MSTKPRTQDLVSWALWRAEISVDLALDAAFAPLGLTTTLQGILRAIAEAPGQSTAELARHAGVRPQSMTHAVTKLERLGMITRAPHPSQGRILQIFITDAGHQALHRAAKVLLDVEAELTADLTPNARDTLLRNLAAIQQRGQRIAAAEASRTSVTPGRSYAGS